MKTEETAQGALETWTVAEVAVALKADEIAIIDVRTPAEYMFEHIQGALLAPMAFIIPERLPLDGDKPVVLYCGSAKRSEKVARLILETGVTDRIAHMQGGFAAWKEAKLPYRGTDMSTGAPVITGADALLRGRGLQGSLAAATQGITMALEDAKTQVDQAFTRTDPRGLSFENAFGGATSFLRRRYTKDLTGVDVAVTGVPFDQAVTHRPGTRFGPRAIREASTLQAFDAPYGWGYDPLTLLNVADYGDMPFDYANIRDVPARVTAHIGAIMDAGAVPITLGGDHFITLPILRAMAERHGPVALIQFDAHSDTWVDDDPDRIDHGTFLYKAIKQGLVDPAASVSIGIRTDNPDTLGVTILDAPSVHQDGVQATLDRIRAVVGDRPVYVTFDIDALDPAFAPGTGTPVWGGLASWQAAALLRGLAGINMIGGDVVEVSPPYDTTGATAIAGAHVAFELIALYGWNRRE